MKMKTIHVKMYGLFFDPADYAFFIEWAVFY